MVHEITRKALYEKVWTTPMRHLAPEFGISDSALRKQCKKANIPLPPTGHWAKKAAGKPVQKLPLPPRFPGQNELRQIGKHEYSGHLNWQKEYTHNPFPPVPEFDESLEQIHERIITMVGKVSYPTLTNRTHPAIEKLLEEDNERKKQYEENTYEWYKPKYTAPLEKRRLRILNALFLGVQQAGGTPSITHPRFSDEKIKTGFGVGNQYIGIDLLTITKRSTTKDKKNKGHLKLTVQGYVGKSVDYQTWEETPDFLLEQNLTVIVSTVFDAAEKQYRDGLFWERDYFIQRKFEIEEEERERLRIEEEEHRKTRLDTLFLQADNLHKAITIRKYVATVQQNVSSSEVSPDELEQWTKWALAQADELDPIKQRAFLTFTVE